MAIHSDLARTFEQKSCLILNIQLQNFAMKWKHDLNSGDKIWCKKIKAWQQ